MSQATAVREEVRREIGRSAVMETGARDPAWLRARRDEAWDIYEATLLPSTRSEEWRYTDVARLLPLDGLVPNAGEAMAGRALPDGLRRAMDQDRDSAGRIVDVDGSVVSVELNESLAAQGVILASLRDAARAGVPESRGVAGHRRRTSLRREVRRAQRGAVERRGLPAGPPWRPCRAARSVEPLGVADRARRPSPAS